MLAKSAVFVVAALALTAVAGCGSPVSSSMNDIAESYVKLVLAVGEHDAAYVDAYYGPAEWRDEAKTAGRSLASILAEAESLVSDAENAAVDSDDPLAELRREYLRSQLAALVARVRMLGGERMTFDEEALALYDAKPPTFDDAHFEALVARLDPLLPGEGTIVERYTAFRTNFVIPPDRLDAVYTAAIDACRERTARRLELPEGESFEVEYVTDVSWGAYNWYKGGYHSLIQVNTDLPIYIDRAVDLACHEGYPGHHVYNMLLEKHLVRDRGWVEFSVYPLFSPQSLIAEGTANYGIEMTFPGDERIEFERETLFPLAGLDPASAAAFYEVQEIAQKLNYAGNEAARRYLDGEIDAEAAAEYLGRFALMAPERAAQYVRFIDDYRSYVINYNLGKDLVQAWIERQGGSAGSPEARWAAFSELMSSPRLPSGLRLSGLRDP